MQRQKENQRITTTTLKKSIITRSQKVANTVVNEGKERKVPKRKAERSPAKRMSLKRSAFGDITNAHGSNITSQNVKKLQEKVTASKPVRTDKGAVTAVVAPPASTAAQPAPKTYRTLKKSSVSTKHKGTAIQKSEEINIEFSTSPVPAKEIEEDISTCCEPQQNISSGTDSSSDGSLYVSSLEDIPSDGLSTQGEPKVPALPVPEQGPPLEVPVPPTCTVSGLPENVEDFDKETLNDPFQVSLYAMDIFNYLKEKEVLFKVDNYMEKQPSISEWMRSLLVDWMVEVQESFELNHETLYLAVKLVDLYLMKVPVSKEILQLIGAAALFIACKYDERIPPQVEDFLYICDGAYTHRELIKMETNVLKVVDFKLGIPLSYRFLRRYARCAKLSLQTLTFARYILELSLIEYSFVSESSSKIAAAALLLALKTKLLGGWTPTLQYYSGFRRNADEICTLLGYNAASSGNPLPLEGLPLNAALYPRRAQISWYIYSGHNMKLLPTELVVLMWQISSGTFAGHFPQPHFRRRARFQYGYKPEDIRDLANLLNAMLHKKPVAALATVRNKYSHKIFFEVAKIPLLEKLDI